MKKIFLLSSFIISSCNYKKEEKIIDLKSNYDFFDKNKIGNQLNAALKKGDTTAYKTAFKNYIITDHYSDFLFFSINMAETYNYGQAYYDSYYLLKSDYTKNFQKKHIPKIAIYYLLKAYELNNEDAKYEINKNFKDSIPSSKIFLKKNI